MLTPAAATLSRADILMLIIFASFLRHDAAVSAMFHAMLMLLLLLLLMPRAIMPALDAAFADMMLYAAAAPLMLPLSRYAAAVSLSRH